MINLDKFMGQKLHHAVAFRNALVDLRNAIIKSWQSQPKLKTAVLGMKLEDGACNSPSYEDAQVLLHLGRHRRPGRSPAICRWAAFACGSWAGHARAPLARKASPGAPSRPTPPGTRLNCPELSVSQRKRTTRKHE
jgi:hypothetical protein